MPTLANCSTNATNIINSTTNNTNNATHTTNATDATNTTNTTNATSASNGGRAVDRELAPDFCVFVFLLFVCFFLSFPVVC